MSTMLGNYVAPIPAQQRIDKSWYRAAPTRSSRASTRSTTKGPTSSSSSAPTTCTMDFSQMVEQHIESGAGVTVAAIRQPIAMSDQFGVIDVMPDDPMKIRAFLEKPTDPTASPTPRRDPREHGQLRVQRRRAPRRRDEGRHARGVQARHGRRHRPGPGRGGAAYTYDFKNNVIPGGTERDMGYWRDVGTMDSYFDAHMDLVSIHPIFNLYNYDWPIYTTYGPYPPPSSSTATTAGSARR